LVVGRNQGVDHVIGEDPTDGSMFEIHHDQR
jgi:hypothetical protein